jgi:hypothetical protein
LLNAIDGVAGVEPTLLDTTTVYRIGAFDRLRFVILPAAAPQIFAGIRTSLSLSLILMVISEMVASSNAYLSRVYSQDRILYPLRRTGPKGSGEFERISWDDALSEISSRWKAIIAEYGAAAILPYSYSGTLGTVEMSVASTRFWGRLGSSESVGDLCSGAALRPVSCGQTSVIGVCDNGELTA